MNLEKVFEQTLREVEVTSESLYSLLYQYFKQKLNIDRPLLPNTFIKAVANFVVKTLLKYDHLFTHDEGFILIPNEGTRLRNGAQHLQIRAFVDIVVQTCSDAANKMRKIPKDKLRPYQKTFIQAFSDESINKTWKPEFAKYLTDKIAESNPFYIDISNP